jgi:hypothetical protein
MLRGVLTKYVHRTIDHIETAIEEICSADSQLHFSGQTLVVEDLLSRGWVVRRDDTPDWPWPITDVEPGGNRNAKHLFDNERSALKICGYRVGARDGMPPVERRRFLDCFFTYRLPQIVQHVFGDEYGDPRSEARLKKMANVIAFNCRNFKRNNAKRFHKAISDWEEDLAYLKQKYYIKQTFVWPSTDVY